MTERKKILVVDDEPEVTAFLAALLEDHGYRAILARSAEEAEKRALEERPDLMCLDILMRGRSGLLLYARLKQNESFARVPAIFLSGVGTGKDFVEPGFRRLVPDPGVPPPAAFIEKPFKEEKLLAAVRAAIG